MKNECEESYSDPILDEIVTAERREGWYFKFKSDEYGDGTPRVNHTYGPFTSFSSLLEHIIEGRLRHALAESDRQD